MSSPTTRDRPPRPPSAPLLVVDDDPDSRAILCALLALSGFLDVVQASDGVDALNRLSAGLRPSLIVLDWSMPSLGGDGVLAVLRRMKTFAEIPVIVLSGVRGLSSQQLGVPVFAKPFDPEALVAAVRAGIALRQRSSP